MHGIWQHGNQHLPVKSVTSRTQKPQRRVFSSVADPGCLSRIPDPDFYPSRISDPGSKNSNKRQGWKNFFVKPYFVATNFTKLNSILFFICWRKKIWPNFPGIIEVFTQKIVTKPSIIWVWDLGSEIRDPGTRKNLFRIPDPGSRGQKGTDPGSATLVFSFYTFTDTKIDCL
jgi:hypothetical protein